MKSVLPAIEKRFGTEKLEENPILREGQPRTLHMRALRLARQLARMRAKKTGVRISVLFGFGLMGDFERARVRQKLVRYGVPRDLAEATTERFLQL